MQMRQFGKRENAIVKGAAIVLMLVHHLFYQEEYLENCIFLLPHEKEGLLLFGQLSKVCVALFVLLSGYGLYKSWENLEGRTRITWKESIQFSFRHIKKLLIQYWWAVIPLAVFGVVSGMRPLSEVYGPNLTDRWKILTDILGINYMLFELSNQYNITCWYLSVAIVLYLIFPILYWMLQKSPFLLWAVVLTLGVYSGRFHMIRECVWLIPFAVGMTFSRWGVLDSVCTLVDRLNWANGLGIALFLVAAARIRILYPIVSDGLLAFAIICVLLVVVRYARPVGITLEFLGKHSTNIFMTHTFFYYYYFRRYFYALRLPALILLSLLLVCVAYSIVLEKGKTCLHTIFSRWSAKRKNDIYHSTCQREK